MNKTENSCLFAAILSYHPFRQVKAFWLATAQPQWFYSFDVYKPNFSFLQLLQICSYSFHMYFSWHKLRPPVKLQTLELNTVLTNSCCKIRNWKLEWHIWKYSAILVYRKWQQQKAADKLHESSPKILILFPPVKLSVQLDSGELTADF